MGRVLALDLDAIGRAVQPQLEEIAESIAADAREGYAMKELKTDNPRNGVVVESRPEGIRVVTYNPFAHGDEWANGGWRNSPSGAMRSAAARHGKFVPE